MSLRIDYFVTSIQLQPTPETETTVKEDYRYRTTTAFVDIEHHIDINYCVASYFLHLEAYIEENIWPGSGMKCCRCSIHLRYYFD